MSNNQLDPMYATELLQRQDALQAEARKVISELDLTIVLSRIGTPEHIGSSASGLMVWRDIDFNVLCSHLSVEHVLETMRPLISNPQVTKMHYQNETGHHAPPELRGDERYYFVTYYETEAGNEWKIDISFWLSDQPHTQLAHLEYLKRTLTNETRLAILWIKDVWHRLPIYPYQIGGFDVYEAVLEHGVRTPAQFEAYCMERGMPTA